MKSHKNSIANNTVSQSSGKEINIKSSKEQWSEFTLEDGTVIKARLTVLSAVRLNEQYDQEGNPAYSLKLAPLVIFNSPDNLKKKTK